MYGGEDHNGPKEDGYDEYFRSSRESTVDNRHYALNFSNLMPRSPLSKSTSLDFRSQNSVAYGEEVSVTEDQVYGLACVE